MLRAKIGMRIMLKKTINLAWKKLEMGVRLDIHFRNVNTSLLKLT